MQNVLGLVDMYKISNKQSDLNTVYLASSEVMFSDGEIHKDINKDGYIKIKSITGNPTYILYIDASNNIVLNVYRYIQETKLSEIPDKIKLLRDKSGIKFHGDSSLNTNLGNKDKAEQVQKPPVAKQQTKSDQYLIDVNTFKCQKCNGTLSYFKYNNDGDLVAICRNCNTEYILRPSRYYTLYAVRSTKSNPNMGSYERKITINKS